MRLLNQTLGLLRNYAQTAECVRSLVALTSLSRVKSVLNRVAIPSVCLMFALSGVYAQECARADINADGVIDDADLLNVLFCFGTQVGEPQLKYLDKEQIAELLNRYLPPDSRVAPEQLKVGGLSAYARLNEEAGFERLAVYSKETVYVGPIRLKPGPYMMRYSPSSRIFETTNLEDGQTSTLRFVPLELDEAIGLAREIAGQEGSPANLLVPLGGIFFPRQAQPWAVIEIDPAQYSRLKVVVYLEL